MLLIFFRSAKFKESKRSPSVLAAVMLVRVILSLSLLGCAAALVACPSTTSPAAINCIVNPAAKLDSPDSKHLGLRGGGLPTVSLTTAATVHTVFSAVFCVPVILTGIDGFIDLIGNGKIAKSDDLKHIMTIDFIKARPCNPQPPAIDQLLFMTARMGKMQNLMITATAFAMRGFDAAAQRTLAWIMTGTLLACFSVGFVIPLGGVNLPPPPAFVYCIAVPGLYLMALLSK
jgi:hypothetical protein